MPELTRAALQSSEWVRLLKENPVRYEVFEVCCVLR